MIKNLLKSKNIQNSYWIIGEKVFQMLLSFVVGILSARYLGPSNYGTLNYTASFVAFFTNIAALSMNSVVMVKLINHPDREGEFLGSAMLYRIVASFLSSISIACLIIVLNPNDALKLTLSIIQSCQLYFKAIEILDVWFQRRLQSKYVSIGKMLASLVVAGYKLFLLITAKGLIWFAFANVLSDCVIAVVLVFFYKREKGQRFCVKISSGNELLKESYHFILSDIMSALYTYLDRIMIGSLMADIDVGYYTTAVTVSSMWIFIPVALINSYRPTIIEYKKNGNEELYYLRYKQLVAVVFWSSAIIALIISIFSKIVINSLYGEAYMPAYGPLAILAWAEVFGVTSMTRSIWILSENKNKYVKYYVFVGAFFNCFLNYILISILGITGAAIATLITQVIVCILAPVLFKETKKLTVVMIEAIGLKWMKEARKQNEYC